MARSKLRVLQSVGASRVAGISTFVSRTQRAEASGPLDPLVPPLDPLSLVCPMPAMLES